MQDVPSFIAATYVAHPKYFRDVLEECVSQCKTVFVIHMTKGLLSVCTSWLQTGLFCIRFKSRIRREPGVGSGCRAKWLNHLRILFF